MTPAARSAALIDRPLPPVPVEDTDTEPWPTFGDDFDMFADFVTMDAGRKPWEDVVSGDENRRRLPSGGVYEAGVDSTVPKRPPYRLQQIEVMLPDASASSFSLVELPSVLSPTTAHTRLLKRMRNDKRASPAILRRAMSRVAHGRPRTASLRTAVTKLLRKSHDCVICQCPIEGVQVRVPCGHYFDVPCLINLVEVATRDESLFPPSCCHQRILDRSFTRFMPSALRDVFAVKDVEFSTTCRVYCAKPSCSRFLGARRKDSFAPVLSCPSPGCGTHTCSRCRGAVHPGRGHRCEHDSGQKAVLELASQKGWARCPACDQMIELRSGCYHMTCVCAVQFCYLCKSLWKTCHCPRLQPVELRDWDQPVRRLSIQRRASDSHIASHHSSPANAAMPKPLPPPDKQPSSMSKIRRVPVPRLDDTPEHDTTSTDSLDAASQVWTEHILLRGLVAQRSRRAVQLH